MQPVANRVEDALWDAASNEGERPAIIEGGRSVTYAELAAMASRFANTLVGAGLQSGDRVVIYLDKSIAAVAALYATWMAGAVVVQANTLLRSRQVEHIARDCGARLLVTSSRFRVYLDESAFGECAFIEAPYGSGAAPSAPPRLFNSPPAFECAAILYTSGSSGLPKGIVVSHQNLIAGTRIVAGYLDIQPDERIISIVPFSFDYGLNQLLTAVLKRAVLVLQRSSRAADVCRTLAEQRITAMAGVPNFWAQLMWGRSPFPSMHFPHLRYITNTGGTFPVQLVERYRVQLPDTSIFLMYGLTEAFRSTYLPPEEVDRRPGSIGRGIPECDVFALNADGRRCGPGEEGELVHRGPTTALGYWNDPDATARVFREDPLSSGTDRDRVVYSGDLVRMDDGGFFHFVGRRDQMIKSQGVRVSPDEVEALALTSGLLLEAVVTSELAPEAGSAIVLHCVPRAPEEFDERDLQRYFRREAPRYMRPRTIIAHDEFPRLSSGKIDRSSVVR